jgi:hypothetical protein
MFQKCNNFLRAYLFVMCHVMKSNVSIVDGLLRRSLSVERSLSSSFILPPSLCLASPALALRAAPPDDLQVADLVSLILTCLAALFTMPFRSA